jgi:hemoglobin
MPTTKKKQEKSLYHRLGGYDVIAAVIDEGSAMLRADPRFARFGAGRSLNSRNRARQLTVDQVCALAGGPCVYFGHDMKTAHAGLGITESEWKINMEYTAAALDKFQVPPKEKEEFLELFARYKNEIVEDPNR